MKGWLTLKLLWIFYLLKVCSSTNSPGGGCYHPSRVSGSEVSLNGTVRKNGTYPVGTLATHTCPRGAFGTWTHHRQTCTNNGSWSHSDVILKCDTHPCTRWLGSKWPIAKGRVGSVCFGLQDDLTLATANNFVPQCRIFSQILNGTEITRFQDFLASQSQLLTKFCEASKNENIIVITDQFSPRGYSTMYDDNRDVAILRCGDSLMLHYEKWVYAIQRFHHWICLYNATCSPPDQNEISEVDYEGKSNISGWAWYKCPKGFSMPDQLGMRRCKEDGLWSRSAPSCHYMGCFLPKKVANVSYYLLNASLLEGSLLEQSCPSDMMMSGESRFRRCIKGRWDGEAAECHAVASDARILNQCSLKLGIIIILGVSVAVIVVIWVIVGVTIWRKRQQKKMNF